MKIGTRLYGPFGQNAIVTAVYGTPAPETVRSLAGGCVVMGGRCEIDFIDNEGNEHRRLPEAFIGPNQRWKIAPGEAAADEIAAAHAAAALAVAAASAKKEADARAYAEAKAALLAEYPYLIPATDRNAAAKNCRILLKRAFPDTKFSVTVNRYSGGSSMNVQWTDGPGSPAVSAIADRFSDGDFSGMDDSYTYRRGPWTDLFGGEHFVFCRRDHSPEALRAAIVAALPDRDLDETAALFNCGRLDYHDTQAVREALKEV